MTQEREYKKMKKALQDLSDSILLYLDAFDTIIGPRKDIPHDISSWLGKSAAALEFQNDSTRFFVLGVNYRTDDKKKVVKRLIAKRKKGEAK